jgi:hypothetical protein
MTRLRAADDFVAIRARLEEPRRDRAQAWAGNAANVAGPQPCNQTSPSEKPGLSPAIRRVLYRSAAKTPGE